MNLITAWRARCAGTLPELEQAILRLIIVGSVMLNLWWWLVSRDSHLDERDIIILTGLAAWFAVGMGILSAIWIRPTPSLIRRVLGILGDVGLVTFALFLTGESSVFLVGVYLFIIFGNGFRYGRSYSTVSQVFCLMGFVPVLVMAPWWQHERVVGMSLLIWMIVLPMYVAVLAERINQARLRAEEALRECVDRERGGVA